MSKSNKPKKPIYKRVWPYILLVCLIGAGVGGASSDKDEPEERSGFGSERTVVITPSQPQAKKGPFMEPTPEPLELLEPETTREPVTRSAPAQQAQTEDTTQETTEEPAEETAPEPAPTASQEENYVLNTNSYKFHKPYCSSCKDIKPENRSDVTKSRDEIIALGYQPCKICNP